MRQIAVDGEKLGTQLRCRETGDTKKGSNRTQLSRPINSDELLLSEGLETVQHIIDAVTKDAGPLAEVLEHQWSTLGKRLRPRFTLLFSGLNQSTIQFCDEALHAAAAIELIHEASLIHDDICDESLFRRNKPSVAEKFGIAKAGWAGGYLAAKALELLALVKKTVPLDKVDISTLRRLAKGQLLEMTSVPNTLEELKRHYLLVANEKTGALFEFACHLGATIAHLSPERKIAVRQFAKHWSLAFQIMDDIRDIEGSEILGKPGGSDLKRGIPTWPLIEWGLVGQKSHDFIFDAMNHAGSTEQTRQDISESGALQLSKDFAVYQMNCAEKCLSKLNGCIGVDRIRIMMMR